jgi:hypothetical protein
VGLRRHDDKPRKKAAELEGSASGDADSATKEQRIVVCAACGHHVADVDARITIAGSHEHTCVNPAAIIYRIACYQRAPGCVGHGERSDHFSWFAGYVWQIRLCGRCHAHLGWSFDGSDPPFVGLIVDRVEERRA